MKTNLQKLQNRAARIVTGDTYDIRSKHIFEKLGWKTLEERREDKPKKFIRKIVKVIVLIQYLIYSKNPIYNRRSKGKLLRHGQK